MASQRYDLHVHSSAAGGLLAPRELVALAAERGLAGIALTDTNTMSGIPEASAMASALGLDLIPGIEMTSGSSEHGDVPLLGYFFSDGHAANGAFQADSPAGASVEQTVDSIHRAGGVVVLARPGVRFTASQLQAVVEWGVACGIDGIEVDHPEHNEDAVRRCVELAERFDLVQISGSDDRGLGSEGNRLGCRTVTARTIEVLRARATASR